MAIDEGDKELIDRILSEINMTEEHLQLGAELIKEWVITLPHLPPSAQDMNLIKAFIISCESVESAKKTLDYYFTCRTKYFDPFFKSRDPQQISWNKVQKFVRLPGLTPEGYIVQFMRMPDKDEVNDFDLIETCRVSFMNLDLTAHGPDHMNPSLLIVCDAANFSAKLMMKCMFNVAGQSTHIIQKAFPIKIRGFVTFNAPGIAEIFFNTLMKPFLSEELKKRNYMYSSDHYIVQSHCPLEMLPSDYEGGQSPPVEELWNDMKEKILSQRNWLLGPGSEIIDENLKPKTPKKLKNEFKQIQFD